MKSRSLHFKILPVAVVLAGLFALQWAWMPKPGEVERRQANEKINLALRQAAHRLLKLEGDSTSLIPPVSQVAENEFLLRLESQFNYDSLPGFLDAALTGYQIGDVYTVAVKSCEDENLLVLGYSLLDFTEKKDVPCGGREQGLNCYNVSLTFPDRPAGESNAGGWKRMLPASGILLSLSYVAFVVFGFVKNKKPETQAATATENEGTSGSEVLRFGNTAFDVANQTVEIGKSRQSLTFREAKLLHVFCKNVNQLLDRNVLLEEVWGDEGVIVGRSLDVFVSRLRKILKADKTVKIANVHSVGYRLEIIDKTTF